jgi:hypothetical protein
MATRKDGSVQNLDEGRNTDLSRQDELTADRRGSEDDAETENVSGDVEEGEEDFDDEELSEEDFDVDDDDVDEDDEEDDDEEIG